MKRRRQSWATRPLPPLTAEEIEDHLDFVAGRMQKAARLTRSTDRSAAPA